MARRKRARSHGVLEWVFKDGVLDTSLTDVDYDLDLDLMDDEVAEIHLIESKIVFEPTSATPTVDQIVVAALAISMDPDYDDIPTLVTAANSLEDLEVFYDHQYAAKFDTEGTEANFQFYGTTSEKHMKFDPPILVGTNLGVSTRLINTTNEFDAYTGVRVYFTRRKANVAELNQILLKRR